MQIKPGDVPYNAKFVTQQKNVRNTAGYHSKFPHKSNREVTKLIMFWSGPVRVSIWIW